MFPKVVQVRVNSLEQIRLGTLTGILYLFCIWLVIYFNFTFERTFSVLYILLIHKRPTIYSKPLNGSTLQALYSHR